jgi:predicted aspartyl protease
MSSSFDPWEGPIIVRGEVKGPTDAYLLRWALDTGATDSLLSAAILTAIGYEPSLATDRIQITTASGVEYVPRVTVEKLIALGTERHNFAVLAHTLPPSAGVDGLLGLDFLRRRKVTIDVRRGRLKLE